MSSGYPKYSQIASLSHDISYAVFRVSALVGHEYLRRELEGAAIDLVKIANEETTGRLLRIIHLAEVLGEMNQLNAGVLCRELTNLQKVLSDASEIHSEIHSEISELFSEPKEGTVLKIPINTEKSLKKTLERQEVILQLVRKFPNGCRMKDLVREFPDCTERTVRNDVQRLVRKGLARKLGSKRGPFSYVKAVDSAHTTDSTHSAVSEQADSPQAGPAVTKEELLTL